MNRDVVDSLTWMRLRGRLAHGAPSAFSPVDCEVGSG